MLKKLFDGNSKSITSAAVIIGAASLTSRVLGFLRDRVLAGEFGAGGDLDVYYAAFRIPDLVFNLLVLGTLSAGFIPVFSTHIKKNLLGEQGSQHDGWGLVNNLLHVLLILLFFCFLIIMIFASKIMTLLAPGFSAHQIEQATTLTRIMFLSPIFLGISGVIGGVLQSYKRFFVYSLAPIFYNIGIIIGALYLAPRFGLIGLAWGVVIGAFSHLVIQLPTLYILGYRYRPILDLKDSGMKTIFRMMVPRSMSLAISQLNFLVVTVIGSTLAQGSISIFYLANNIQSFPLGIFGISFAIAAFPTLSELVDNKEKFIESFISTVKQILFFIVPASALLLVLRAQVVRTILGTGRFNWEDTILTMDVLSFFILSLFAQSLIPLFSRAFFAYKDSKTPFFAGLASAVLNIILSFVLAKKYGITGLALAFSLSSVTNLILLWVLLRKKIATLHENNIFTSVLKISSATFLLVLTAQATKYIVEPIFGTNTFIGIFVQGASAGIAGIIVYVLCCTLFKLQEAQIFLDSFRKKFYKKFKPTEIIQE